ncbi:MAG: hypothetical protein ACI8RD_010447, partial [Bacillariaceae sp.]
LLLHLVRTNFKIKLDDIIKEEIDRYNDDFSCYYF